MHSLRALLGIDVAMVQLSACLKMEDNEFSRNFENTPNGHKELYEWAISKAHEHTLTAAVEATGNHHKTIVGFLRERGISCLVLNPRHVRDLAKGLGIACKTDKADARIIAKVIEVPDIKCQAERSKLHDELRDISRQIQALTELSNDARHRFGTPSRSEHAKASDEALILFCKQQITALEKQWLKLLDPHVRLKEKYDHQLILPGIGHKTARVVISELPECNAGRRTKQLARYSGTNPNDRQSGEKVSHAPIQGGNPHLRRAFYMPALRAIRYDEDCKALYLRLRLVKQRPHKQALTAVMHKLIRRSAAVHIRHAVLT